MDGNRLQFSNIFISYLTLFITVTCNKCNYNNSKTKTGSVFVLKIHVSNNIKNGAQYYVEQGNKKIHLQDLIFDELDNSDDILDYICP